jgi:hypothetical protein
MSNGEERLLSVIKDGDLLKSLHLLREAAEKIWDNDTPCIIKDFTDHGMSHSKRLADYAARIINSNEEFYLFNEGSLPKEKLPLTEQDIYLLLASIYLHDLGMKCDIIHHPEIKKKAEEYGAKFEVTFKAPRACDYNKGEQNEIRKNHHYLTAAWIYHAYRNGETSLSHAACYIPKELIARLRIVCMYHSKLDINDDFIRDYDSQGRTQLVAAILRLSDEMDVDLHRVSHDTLKNFRLDPNNAVYWWIHSLTRIEFNTRNSFSLEIGLNSEDYMRYKPILAKFIEDFEIKNGSLIRLLNQKKFEIIMSAFSTVKPDEFAHPLPREIKLVLDKWLPKPKSDLARDVDFWMKTINYETTEPKQIKDDRTMEIKVKSNPDNLRVTIHCIDGEITGDDFDYIIKTIDCNKEQGWLICDSRVSKEARERAEMDNIIKIFTLSDFIKQKLWENYIEIIHKNITEKNLVCKYSDLSYSKCDFDSEGNLINQDVNCSLDQYIENCIKERNSTFVFLMGEIGKTWFCLRYVYHQLDRYIRFPTQERLPILISLNGFSGKFTLEQLLMEGFFKKYTLPFGEYTVNLFLELNRIGKLIFILDDLDKIKSCNDPQTFEDNLNEIAKLIENESKVIILTKHISDAQSVLKQLSFNNNVFLRILNHMS